MTPAVGSVLVIKLVLPVARRHGSERALPAAYVEHSLEVDVQEEDIRIATYDPYDHHILTVKMKRRYACP
jgi:hypothetical protein